jgi:hypothetical protein
MNSSHALVTSTASLLVLGLMVGCGGKQIGSAPDSGSGDSDGGTYTEPDGAICVDIDLSTYDQSCNQASDCTEIRTGTICTGQCVCGDSPVNASEQSRYAKAIAPITSSGLGCSCIGFAPQCIHHTCTLCEPDSTDPECNQDGGTDGSEAGAGPDGGSSFEGGEEGGACVNIDPAAYGQSCKKSSDCVAITSGSICDGSCLCGGSTINKSSEAAYEAAISGIHPGECECPAEGQPTCVEGMCVVCGFGSKMPSGCPDGG